MTPTLYKKYEESHPKFKVLCVNFFSDFLGYDSWFSNSKCDCFSPFQSEKEELEMWKKYELTRSNDIRDKLVSKYVWLTFRIFLSLNIDKYYKTKDEMFQEGLILLWNCVVNFNMNSNNSFYSYYCSCMKHKIKTLRSLYMGRKVLNLSCYTIMDSKMLTLEDPNECINNSPLALKLCRNLDLSISKKQKIKDLMDLIDNMFFKEPSSIYIKSPKDDEETIIIEDKLDYSYNSKVHFLEGRIDELNKVFIYLYYSNNNINNRKHVINLKSLEYSLEILFYTCGFIKTKNGFKLFANGTTKVEASDHFKLTRQGVSVRLDTLLKNLKLCSNEEIVKNILNGTMDANDIIQNIGEKEDGEN